MTVAFAHDFRARVFKPLLDLALAACFRMDGPQLQAALFRLEGGSLLVDQFVGRGGEQVEAGLGDGLLPHHRALAAALRPGEHGHLHLRHARIPPRSRLPVPTFFPGRSEGRVQGQPIRSVLIEKGANGLPGPGSCRGAEVKESDQINPPTTDE
ncbi:hypothetical protein [Brevundimonas sp. EYE_349]|nr:hypothetical protein [Brevundimonas sp. EYE_349]MCK6105319.1 hypothetical protein [Brevundimonas sp. EYE_349]